MKDKIFFQGFQKARKMKANKKIKEADNILPFVQTVGFHDPLSSPARLAVPSGQGKH
jgi:hypothetical protein